jgi:3-oxoacyl-[acyl-carrier-protein] synthase III
MASHPSFATITAIATAFPRQIRTNAWWDEHYPELVANAREATLARLWADFEDGRASAYDRTIAQYLSDPFRGTVERRVMGPGMSAQQLEVAAARAALAAGDIDPASVDLILLAALRPDSLVVGDAAFLVRELGLRAPAVSFETACSSALVGFSLAADLVRAGRHRKILVVVCCTYTRDVDLGDSFSWFLGDGAAAFVVEPSQEYGILGAHTIPTTETCGAFAYEPTVVDGAAILRLRANRAIAGRRIRDNSELYLRRCVDGALSHPQLHLRLGQLLSSLALGVADLEAGLVVGALDLVDRLAQILVLEHRAAEVLGGLADLPVDSRNASRELGQLLGREQHHRDCDDEADLHHAETEHGGEP